MTSLQHVWSRVRPHGTRDVASVKSDKAREEEDETPHMIYAHHYLLNRPALAGVIVVVVVTGQDLLHFFVAPDDPEEATPIMAPQTTIWRTSRGNLL